MRPLLRALGLLGLLLCAQSAQAEKLRLVADAWPPFTDARLPRGGLATALVTTALERAGFASEFEQAPWARALLGIGEGRYDVLINAWQSDARTRIGAFSQGYLSNRVRLLKRKGDVLRFDTLSDLYPHAIAVVRDFSVAVGMLAAGRVRLTLEDEYVARYYLQRESANVRNRVQFFGKPVSENSLHILVSLRHPQHAQIVAGFDKAIAAMKADGSYARLLKDYGL